MDFFVASLLAVIEGITEFLPISSTGHMILVEDYLKLGTDTGFADTFMVAIQLPAILAVVVYFWNVLWPFGRAKDTARIIWLWIKIVAAFLPAAILGFLFDDLIEAWLFNSVTVALALIVGGVILIALELRPPRNTMPTVHDICLGKGILIGLFQCLAMIPGTSRSAATIIGGMLLGASRPAAAEFSFFLAIPTMLGATTLKMLKNGLDFTPHQWGLLAVGSVVSFVVAYAVVAAFMRYIRSRSFAPFGYYRIALGLVVLLLLVL